MSTKLKNTWEWFKRFFSKDTNESMTRLLNYGVVKAGIIIIFICIIFKLEGAHYGLELVLAGLFGKGYQDYTNYRRDKSVIKEDKDGTDI